MREIRTDHDRPALVEFANLDLLVSLRRFQKNQVRAAARGVATKLLQSEDILIKRDCLLQIAHPIASVEEFFDHALSYCPRTRLNSNSTTRSETRISRI